MTGGLALSLALLLAALVAACAAGPSAERSDATGSGEPTTVASSPRAEVFFPQLRPAEAYPGALGHGKLVLDNKGCIRMKLSEKDPGWVVLWPANFELDVGDDEIRILDGKGRVRAQVGEEVPMGGGEVGDSLEGLGGLDEQLKREVQKRCPGTYWFASPEVNIPRQR